MGLVYLVIFTRIIFLNAPYKLTASKQERSPQNTRKYEEYIQPENRPDSTSPLG